MTDPHAPDPSAVDPSGGTDLEVVSAYLDGAATPEERARVDSDPALRRQVDRLRTVRDHLAVGPPASELVDAHVAAALDARGDAGLGGAPVGDLDRARTRAWLRRVPLGAVAAALLLVALVGGIALRDTGSDTVASGDAAETSAALDGAGGGGEAFEEGADDAADGAARQDLDARLVFDDTDALAAHLADQAASTSGTTAAAEAAPHSASGTGGASDSTADEPDFGSLGPCDPIAAADIGDAPVLAFVRAVVADRDVTAVIVDGGDAPRLLVVDEDTCTVVDDRPVPDQ